MEEEIVDTQAVNIEQPLNPEAAITEEHVVESASIPMYTSLTAKIESALIELNQLVLAYRQKIQAVEDWAKNLQAATDCHQGRMDELVSRETKVKDIENVITLKQDAQSLMDSANLRLNAAKEAEIALSQHVAEQNQIIQNKANSTQREANNLEIQKKDMDNEVCRRVDAFLIQHGFKAAKPVEAAPIVNEESAQG